MHEWNSVMELEFLQIKLVIHKKFAIYKNRKQTNKQKKTNMEKRLVEKMILNISLELYVVLLSLAVGRR